MSSNPQDERVQIACPHCGQQLRIRMRNMGKKIKCTACRHRFMAPRLPIWQSLIVLNADKLALSLLLLVGCGLVAVGWYFGEAFGVPPALGAVVALVVSVLAALAVDRMWARFG
jgi:predicted Zn finger-like uncharacterized protein